MKKRFILTVLPALLVLSACQISGQNKKNSNLFLEDTLAHEEIFGDINFDELTSGANKLAQPGVRKLADPVEHPDSDPAIGVQSMVETAGCISFRFVAAVTFPEGKLAPTNASWKRTVSQKDGESYPLDTGDVECTTAYTSLSTAGDPYTIADFNDAQEPDTSYTHFVVYTLRNVPVDSNDYFVSAYLTLSGEGGVSLTSKAVAINASQTLKYSYTHNLGTAFIDGTFDGTPDIIDATSVRTSVDDDNKATFEGLNLKENDSFVIKEFYDTKLYVKDSDILTGTKNPIGYYFADDSSMIKTNYNGTYNLYLNKSNELWTAATNVSRPVYVSQSVGWSGTIAIYAFKDSTSAEGWFQTTLVNGKYKTSGNIDPTIYDHIIVVLGSSSPVSWSNMTDQTVNLDYTSNVQITDGTIEDCFYVWKGAQGSRDGSWGSR